jgi:hypothetical protein
LADSGAEGIHPVPAGLIEDAGAEEQHMTDLTVPTVPSTIQVRPSRLVAILLAAVVLTAAMTWSLANLTMDDDSSQSRGATPAVTAEDLQAAYAGVYADRIVPAPADRALAAATLAAGITPGAVPTATDAGPEAARSASTGGAGGFVIPAHVNGVHGAGGPLSAIGGAGSFIPTELPLLPTTPVD